MKRKKNCVCFNQPQLNIISFHFEEDMSDLKVSLTDAIFNDWFGLFERLIQPSVNVPASPELHLVFSLSLFTDPVLQVPTHVAEYVSILSAPVSSPA